MIMTNLNPQNLQANILKGHGRKYAWCVFIKQENLLKEWLKKYSNIVTSAEEQHRQKILREESIAKFGKNINSKLLTSFFISKKGYEAFFTGRNLPGQNADHFISMEDNDIKDAEKKTWKKNYKKDIYGMVLFAYENGSGRGKKYLERLTDAMFRNYSYGQDYFIEKGEVLRNENGQVVEAFGYRDGISQPKLLAGVERTLNGNEKLLLNQEICNELIFDKYGGSYLVFRKLEQDIKEFKIGVIELAHELGISEQKAGAQIVGRFKDGTPLTHFEESGNAAKPPSKIFNNDPDSPFSNADQEGQRCPFHSHIRKSNPRMNHSGDQDFAKRKIVRRGIPYNDSKKTGLLFLCFQKNINKQFEFIQSQWCNDFSFPSGKKTGIDPLIGQHRDGKIPEQKWNVEWGNEKLPKKDFMFKDVVTLKGGEYFYAPSFFVLKGLARAI
jgi:Dyp-type peroxidase family